jgi:hypothetical protein
MSRQANLIRFPYQRYINCAFGTSYVLAYAYRSREAGPKSGIVAKGRW